MKIDIISVQPRMFEGFLNESIIARAQKKGACVINIIDLKEFGLGRWHKTDDKPFGGGPGMLMRCEPWFAAVESVRTPTSRVIMTSPKGKRWSQREAERFACLAEGKAHLIFMCGHYEGFDARIESLATDFYSLGDFVMTGGEIASAAFVDSIVRLLPGVLGGGAVATANESFAKDGVLEAPQYTHPAEFRGMKVPEVLLSGDHRKIEAWQKSNEGRQTC